MKELLAAGKKPVAVVSADELELVEAAVAVTGRTKPAVAVRKNQVFTGVDAVAQLVAALRGDGVL